MTDYSKGSDPDGTGYYLITCDEYIEKFADELRSSGCSVTGEMMELAASAAEPFRSCVSSISTVHLYRAQPSGSVLILPVPCRSPVLTALSLSAELLTHIRPLQVPGGYRFDADF